MTQPKLRGTFVLKRAFAIVMLVGSGSLLHGQASPTASRRGDAQVGGGYSIASPDYGQPKIKGFNFYGDFDFTRHLGVEAEFHFVKAPGNGAIYEKTYEIGGRYFRTYGRVIPYGKIMVGRGVFNYPGNVANLAYNMYAIGAGSDFRIKDWLNARADYEYQNWTGFPTSGLTPQVFSIGVAYHFR